MTTHLPFEPEDILLEQRITQLSVLSERQTAICAVQRTLPQADRYASDLWALPLDEDASPRRLTQGDHVDAFPRCSPDGHTVAFLSDRGGGSPQLHLIDLDGGEARPLGFFGAGVQFLAWRPDGRQLAAGCAVRVDPEQRREGTMSSDVQAPGRHPHTPELVWRLPYESDGTGYELAKRTHLFLMDVDTGQGRSLTAGDFDVHDVTWTPDGRHVVFSRNRDTPGCEQRSDLWMLAPQGQEAVDEPRQLSFEQSSASSPSCSPDGRWIAFTGALAEGDSQMRLWLVDTETGRGRRSATSPSRSFRANCIGTATRAAWPSSWPVMVCRRWPPSRCPMALSAASARPTGTWPTWVQAAPSPTRRKAPTSRWSSTPPAGGAVASAASATS
jgi:dipeptidyl aminopeptidase/acylaminoacyl peptidase